MRHWLDDLWRATLWQFPSPCSPRYSEASGRRVLIGFALLGLGLLPLLQATLGVLPPAWMASARLALVLLMLAAFALSLRRLVRLPAAKLGLRPPTSWSRRERLFLAFTAVGAGAAFALLHRTHLSALWQLHGAAGFILFAIGTGVLWGALQELLYRALLQTELVRRWGAMAGVLSANLLFAFGPLHLNLWLGAPSGEAQWSVLAAEFGIGLVFGLLYQRSGNVWIPAILHGLWPPNFA